MDNRTGFFTLLHHEGPIVEWSDDVEERLAYIKSAKPAHEQAVRLRHIVRVPEERCPALYEAWAQYRAVQQPAWAQYRAVEQPAMAQYRAAERPAWAQYEAVDRQAWAQYEAIQQAILNDPATLALVRELVPDCRWDGETIFPHIKEDNDAK